MATTKKVAGSVEVKNKKTSPRSIKVKNAVAKKAAVSKSSGKKAVAVSILNKTSKTHNDVSGTPKVAAKLKKVEELHTKRQQKSVVPLAKLKKGALAIKPTLALAVLSPYRFPMDIDKIAVNTARFGGVFFVLLGAVFTLLLANTGLLSEAQVANTLFSGTNTLNTTITTVSNTATTALEPKPKVEFLVNNPDEVHGTAQIKIKVPYAASVTLMAYYKTRGENITLGRPQKVSDDTWEMNVDTLRYEDGEYRLSAVVSNAYGSYEQNDDKYLIIANTASRSGENSGSSQTQQDSTGTTISDPLQSTTETIDHDSDTAGVELTSDKIESATEFRFIIKATNADKVLLYHKYADSSRKPLGYAYKADSDTWKYRWQVDRLQQGKYEVTAEAIYGSSVKASSPVLLKVGATTMNTLSTALGSAEASTSATTVDDSVLKTVAPEIKVSVEGKTPLFGVVPLKIEVKDALSAEVFTLPKNALVQRYLGSARKVDDSVWTYRWDTTATPNGEYKLVVYVRNSYGNYTRETSSYSVFNPVTAPRTEEQQQTIEKLTAVVKEELATFPAAALTPAPAQTADAERSESVSVPVPDQQRVAPPVPVVEEEEESELATLMDESREKLTKELNLLSSALRVKDENAVFEIKERLNNLKQEILASHIDKNEENRLIEKIDAYLASSIKRVEEDVVRIEKVVSERTALKAETDSDKDGITDYDELALYNTDPYIADTDGDGFVDGSEILKGYNPTDAASEVAVVYESPKEAGVVRDDVFIVESITPAAEDSEAENAPAAIIQGKALPNSFVTLYIFSTPVVVTLKTDTEGNWTYHFNKELENGEHEVYVGITDNAGKLVAKSNPFTFVKEAQAFTAVDNAPVPTTAPEESTFLSQYMIYIVLSISVVAIGLVLILLGLHLDSRQRKFGSEIDASATAV
jgi:hypothetical protein